MIRSRVSFETSFDSKQPKLEPKLVSALSETKRLFRLFRFCTETDGFDVSIEPKQTENQPKQFKRVYTRWIYEVYMKYRDENLNLILGSDPAVLSSPSYKCIRQQHSPFKSQVYCQVLLRHSSNMYRVTSIECDPIQSLWKCLISLPWLPRIALYSWGEIGWPLYGVVYFGTKYYIHIDRVFLL